MSALWLTFVNAAAVPHPSPSPAPRLSSVSGCGTLDHAGHLTSAACCHSALRDLPAFDAVCFSSHSQFEYDTLHSSSPPPLTCLHLRLIDANFRRHYCKVKPAFLGNMNIFPTDWCIDMTFINRCCSLCGSAPTVSLISCLMHMHMMSTWQPLQTARLSITILDWQLSVGTESVIYLGRLLYS